MKSEIPLSAIGLIKEKVKTLRDIPGAINFFLVDILSYDEDAIRKHLTKSENLDILELMAKRMKDLDVWNTASIEKCIRDLAAEKEVKAAAVIHPARAAITGRKTGPGLFELMEVLGRDRTILRLGETVKRFRGHAQ